MWVSVAVGCGERALQQQEGHAQAFLGLCGQVLFVLPWAKEKAAVEAMAKVYRGDTTGSVLAHRVATCNKRRANGRHALRAPRYPPRPPAKAFSYRRNTLCPRSSQPVIHVPCFYPTPPAPPASPCPHPRPTHGGGTPAGHGDLHRARDAEVHRRRLREGQLQAVAGRAGGLQQRQQGTAAAGERLEHGAGGRGERVGNVDFGFDFS